MFFTNQFLGMDFLWWTLWSALLIWIFLVPYDITGQRSRKRLAMKLNPEIPQDKILMKVEGNWVTIEGEVERYTGMHQAFAMYTTNC